VVGIITLLLALLARLLVLTYQHQEDLTTKLTTQQLTQTQLQQQLNQTLQQLQIAEVRRQSAEDLVDKVRQFEQGWLAVNTDTAKTYYDVGGTSKGELLNVRSLPGHLSPVLGNIPPNSKCLLYLGQFRIMGESTWVWIQYQQIRGWVNSRFLLESQDPDRCR
jgi:hypothetical protein